MDTNFIAITGMDGTGKTTLAKWFVSYLESKGIKCKYVWIRYQHTLAFLLSKFLVNHGWEIRFKNPNGINASRFNVPKNEFLRVIWLYIEFLSVLPLILLKIKLPLLFNYTIVCDRYVIDTIVTVAISLNRDNFINSFFSRVLIGMIPKNGVVVLLDADLETVLNRRPDVEFSIREINDSIDFYRVLVHKIGGHIINVKDNSKLNVRNEIKKIFNMGTNEVCSDDYSMGVNDYDVVIPTYNRKDKLNNLIKSILLQDPVPKKIIIVDQSDDDNTYNLLLSYKNIFDKDGIDLCYFHIDDKNASKARNVGTSNASSEIILFIDDDIILKKNYVKNILNVYETYPDALGVQGELILGSTIPLPTTKSRLENIIRKCFFLTNFKKDAWLVLPSINDVFPIPLTKTISTQRLQGVCSYKRRILKKYRYDEKLKGWSYLEDYDLSNRIYKSGVGSLYVTPSAKVIHDEDIGDSSSYKIKSFKKIINRNYMFFKLVDLSIKNIIIFYWSILGLIFTTTLGLLIGKHKLKSRLIPIYMMAALFHTFVHLQDIRKFDLDFLNEIL